jgi:hypothetical protein
MQNFHQEIEEIQQKQLMSKRERLQKERSETQENLKCLQEQLKYTQGLLDTKHPQEHLQEHLQELLTKELLEKKKLQDLSEKERIQELVEEQIRELLEDKQLKEKRSRQFGNEIANNIITVEIEEKTPRKILKVDLSRFPVNSEINEIEVIFGENISSVQSTNKEKRDFPVNEGTHFVFPLKNQVDETKMNPDKYEALRIKCKENPERAFVEFIQNSEKITLEDIKFFRTQGVKTREPNSYYPTRSEHPINALHFTCEHLLFDKMKILLEASEDPNLPLGKNSDVYPIDSVICGSDFSDDTTIFEEMGKHVKLLIKHGAVCKISENTREFWKKNVEEKNCKVEGFIKIFVENARVRKTK